MTPQKKAKDIEYNIAKIYRNNWQIISTDIIKDVAKYMVDEILWEIIKYADNSKEYVVENSEYWQQVKQEIEKL